MRTLSELGWEATYPDEANQTRIDDALDVEEVTNRFYRGLRQHYDALVEAVVAAMDGDRRLAVDLKGLGGDAPTRVV